MPPQAPKKAKLSNAVSKKREEPVEEESDFSASSSENSASDSDAAELSEDDEFDEFDDVSGSDVESANESGDESEGGEEDESEEEQKPRKDKFQDAMTAILGSRVKAHDQENPILIRNKRPAREIEDAKEEAKARKALRAERLHKKDKARVRNIIPKDPEEAGDALAKEKRLKKIGQRGVVKLMNAINAAQNAAIAELQGDQQPGPDMSKEKFLDMLRMG